MMKHTAAATLFAAFLIHASLAAQQESARDLTEDMLAAYTEAYIALSLARDDFQREIAGTHEIQEQARLRAEMNDRIASVLSEHEMSAEDYDWITAVISVDESLRDRFEALLAELSTSPPGQPSVEVATLDDG